MKSKFQNRQEDVASKKTSLDAIANKLKTQFVGLDQVIDELIGLVTAWYIFPKAQMRPCVINLWGLTGTGKTALVNELVDHLDYRKLYAHFDMNECNTQGSEWVKKKFSKELTHFDKKQVILCLDEFQFARSIDKYGDEVENELHVIWDLIDTGKISGTDEKKAPFEVDVRHSLVFVLGNLDEAYGVSSNLDPDMNADYVHALTKKITISGIKNALRKRFRAEQISRLGNNHFIYRAFSSEQFKEIIRRELNRLASFVNSELSLPLEFDDSMIDLVYSEGVIPTQGTRPVFTTINNLVQSKISKVAMKISEVDLKFASVVWAFEDGKYLFKLFNTRSKLIHTITEDVALHLTVERKSVKPHLQAHTAVHESGHAVLAALLLRIIPSIVVSRTASHGSDGFCTIRFPEGPFTREVLMMDIAISLGGLAAEKIVFGKDSICSGVGSDLGEASTLANDAIRRYGMGTDPVRLSVVRNFANEDYFTETALYEQESVKLIRESMKVAENVLRRNKLLLLKMSEYLTTNSKMKKELIEEFVRKYSAEDWVADFQFLEPLNYFRFDEIVQSQLKELEAAEKSVELLMTECGGADDVDCPY